MKIKNSLKALKGRHRDNQLVRRKGRIYIINKTAPRYKARQGSSRLHAKFSLTFCCAELDSAHADLFCIYAGHCPDISGLAGHRR